MERQSMLISRDHAGAERKHRSRRLGLSCWLVAAVVAMGTVISACGGTSTSVGSGPLTVGVFMPFEGDEGFAGPELEAECYAAVNEMNATGGLLGHKVQCSPYDSTSDPADAVPAAARMLATASNLILVFGPADQEPPVDPELRAAKVLEYGYNGMPRYDHQTNALWYRPFPSDSLDGVAEGIFLARARYKNVAAVFDTSSGAQNHVPRMIKTYEKVRGKVAINLDLAPGIP